MSGILMLKDKEGASADELFQIMSRYAEKRNFECLIQHIKNISWSEVAGADILICIRGDTPFMRYIINEAKKKNIFVVYFLDDALKDMPDESFRYPKRKKWHLKCVKLCDLLLTTNPLIEEDYKQYIKEQRVALIHTAVNSFKPVCEDINQEKVRIVYAASEWHITNYNLMIRPIIDQLLVNNKDKIELYFVGLNPGISGYEDMVHVVPKMNLCDYQNYMQQMSFDIGLAPLEKSYFSERKYFNKFVEYTRYGICGLYSDVYPYKFVVKDGENGFLIENDPQAWLISLQKAIDSRNVCFQYAKKAQEYLKDNHKDEVIFSKLEKDIPEIKYRKGHNCSEKNKRLLINKFLIFYPFFLKEKEYMFFYSLKNEGVKSAIKRMIRKIS